MVRDEGENERLQTALIENMAREDLNPVDEARACATLVDDLGLTKEELARRVGRSRVAVSNLIRLLDLPEPALDLLRSKELTEGHGRAILQARGADTRRRLARDAAAGGWSVRETERRAKLASKADGREPQAAGAAAPTRPRRSPRPRTRSSPRSAATSASGRRRTGSRPNWCSTTSTRSESSPAASSPAADPRPSDAQRARIAPTRMAPTRAISSVG